ncbi:MAG: hypothetical protein ACKESB_03665 [Candidatus Hodgkinia cicadicola]
MQVERVSVQHSFIAEESAAVLGAPEGDDRLMLLCAYHIIYIYVCICVRVWTHMCWLETPLSGSPLLASQRMAAADGGEEGKG